MGIQFQLIRTTEQNSTLKDVDMSTRHLFVIDSGIANPLEVIRELPIDSEWVMLDAQHDGILQLLDILANHAQLDSLHILSHGAQSSFRLGNTALSGQNIERYADALDRRRDADARLARLRAFFGVHAGGRCVGRWFSQSRRTAKRRMSRSGLSSSQASRSAPPGPISPDSGRRA